MYVPFMPRTNAQMWPPVNRSIAWPLLFDECMYIVEIEPKDVRKELAVLVPSHFPFSENADVCATECFFLVDIPLHESPQD